MIRKNPDGDYPEIDNTEYIDPSATVIMHLAVVKGTSIFPETVVSSSKSISSTDDAKELKHVDKKLKEFAKKVIRANLDLVRGYKNE